MKILSLKKNSIYRKILVLAIPIMIENLIYSVINFVDIFMVGKENPTLGLGVYAISALGASNQFFTLFITSLFGILSGANILAAQYYGADDKKNFRKILGFFMIVSLLYTVPFFIAGFNFSEFVLKFFTNDTNVIALGVDYLKIVIWTYPIVSIGFVFTMLLRAMNLPKYTLYSSSLGLVLNIFLNLLLIPKFGVKGAAAATLIARIVSVSMLGVILIYRKIRIIPKLSEFLEIDMPFIKKGLSISFYTFLHEVLWSSAMTTKAAFFGRTGVGNFSSIQIANNINNLLFTVLIGLTAATAVIVGNQLGNGDDEKVQINTNKILNLYVVIIIAIIVCLNIIAPIILKIMKVDNNIYSLTIRIIHVISLTSSITAYTMLFLVGIFRAGGDIKFSILVEIIPLWFVAVPLTYYFAIVHPIPITFLYFVSYIDEFIKMGPCIMRYRSKKWINKMI